MQISPERLADFKKRWKKVFREELSDGETRQIVTRLVRFYDLITRPLPNLPKDAHAAQIVPSNSGRASRTPDSEVPPPSA